MISFFRFLLVAVAGILFAGCSREPSAAVLQTPQAVPIKVAVAFGTNVPVRLCVPAQVSPFSSVAVRSQVDGVVQSVHFHEGDLVHAGQLLFTIDPKPFETAVAQQQAILA